MPSLFAGIHVPNKPNEFISLAFDFDWNVRQLKEVLAARLQIVPTNLEIIYAGEALDDDLELRGHVQPNATVHCFCKTKKYEAQTSGASTTENVAQVQELFNVIAHIQINVNSRVNILQKILAEYPEFRRNLGAQALIRDSVLFNTLHQPEVIHNIAEHYPIICEAAPFIVDTIKKELTRNPAANPLSTNFSLLNAVSEPATDSTNSSEEENSQGASSSSERADTASGSQSENARIRQISRQQLQAALAQIGFGSVNSLSNIAQRNTESNAGSSAPLLSNSTSGERISSELFRNELQRALTTLGQRPQQTQQQQQQHEADTAMANSGDVPVCYRNHPYYQQLRTMAQMGFTNYEENLTYLNITNGNIENAINLLMGSIN